MYRDSASSPAGSPELSWKGPVGLYGTLAHRLAGPPNWYHNTKGGRCVITWLLRTILIVEDDFFIRTEIAAEFRAARWRVLESASAEGAIALLARRVDIVFTDIRLAGELAGWDVADAFRRMSPEAPVVYASGNAPDRFRQVEGSHFFGKPYVPAAVLSLCLELVAAR
jgi:CheY-like chemotaxis protein